MREKHSGLPCIPHRYWYRFLDDTWIIQQQAQEHIFLDHINSIDPSIKFTAEGNRENEAIPFCDTLVKPKADNSLSIRMYHKPTHTDQYLQWDSHHNLSVKYSVIGTLTHRAKSVCTTPGLLNEEVQHLKEALVRYKYSRWVINKIQNKVVNGNWEDNGNNHAGNTLQDTNGPRCNNPTTTTLGGRPSMGHIIISYVQGMGKASSTSVANIEFKHISKVIGPSNRYWSSPKTRTPRRRKVVSFTVSSVQPWTVGRSILEKHLGPWGRGTRNT